MRPYLTFPKLTKTVSEESIPAAQRNSILTGTALAFPQDSSFLRLQTWLLYVYYGRRRHTTQMRC
ncbi:hypothetical protein J6590_045322 [Homalodisca vitripennis]|nr:hypothetical protein J6590_045322 [Homalodisca vitripennis]